MIHIFKIFIILIFKLITNRKLFVYNYKIVGLSYNYIKTLSQFNSNINSLIKKGINKTTFITYGTLHLDNYNKINTNNDKNISYDNIDIFHNDGLQLKQWYFSDKVKEKWKDKHIENIKANYKKVLLNNKYNELFNMYKDVNNNNIENFKKRAKTNRINPSIYIKKRLVSATAKHMKMSFIKTRKILWKIRYMSIIRAFAFLYYYGINKYTVSIYKCIKSCLYNAINKYGKDNIKPVFHTLQANMGGYVKSINIRAKGRTDIIREPYTHIRVVLEV